MKNSNPVLEKIQSWPEPQQQIALRIREIIAGTGAGLEEGIKWGHPTYYDRENICSIIPHRDHVNLQLFHGSGLDDPENILEGTGKRMRHIKITNIDKIYEEAIRSFVRQSIKMQD